MDRETCLLTRRRSTPCLKLRSTAGCKSFNPWCWVTLVTLPYVTYNEFAIFRSSSTHRQYSRSKHIFAFTNKASNHIEAELNLIQKPDKLFNSMVSRPLTARGKAKQEAADRDNEIWHGIRNRCKTILAMWPDFEKKEPPKI